MNTNTLNWPQGASVYKDGRFYTLNGRPVNAGAAMDAAHSNASVDDAAVAAKIARAKGIVTRNAEDDAAIRKLFPSVLAAANDDAEAEAEALGLTGEDSPDNEVEGASYEATLKASVDYWNGAKRQNSQRAYPKSSGVYTPVPTAVRNRAKAADGNSIALNAKRAKSYSMFSTAAQLCKATA